jgi:hypothetical protein
VGEEVAMSQYFLNLRFTNLNGNQVNLKRFQSIIKCRFVCLSSILIVPIILEDSEKVPVLKTVGP